MPLLRIDAIVGRTDEEVGKLLDAMLNRDHQGVPG
jgi:hypothetical protein